MNILAKLNKEKFEVYKVMVIKELKQSKKVKLAPVNEKGEVISGQWSEYNMPNERILEEGVGIKYRGPGTRKGNWMYHKDYTNITEYCPRSTDLEFLFKQKEKENKHLLLYILKQNKEVLSRRNEENETYKKQKIDKIEKLHKEIKSHEVNIFKNNSEILRINEKIKLLEVKK